jgi:ATP-dependent RNA helicase RhlE
LSFEDFSIDPRCLQILNKQGITTPSPVQAEAVPAGLEGKDVLAIAQTGTGKTLAFGLPALTRLATGGDNSNGKKGRNRMLVLTPTRELAVQVHDVLRDMGKPLGLRTVAVYGGVGMEPQTRALRRGVDIVVACPGRLLDHMNRGNAKFGDLSMLVLDEADRMLDMGFLPDIKRILKAMPTRRQTMMFSATFPNGIKSLATDFQRDPVRIEIAPTTPAKAVRQTVYTVDPKGKLPLLTKLLAKSEVVSALVFIRTKHRTDRVTTSLGKAGFKAQAIHGGRTQGQRQRALDGFRKGKFNILVATDVAARGLDIKDISHVFNFDIPTAPDDYIHRIGRTGRANAEGDAITLVSPEDHQALGLIERTLGKAIPREDWEGAVNVRSGSTGGGKRRPGKRGPGPRRGRTRTDRPAKAKGGYPKSGFPKRGRKNDSAKSGRKSKPRNTNRSASA